MVQGLFSLLIVGAVSAVSMPKMTEILHQHLLMGIAQEVEGESVAPGCWQ